VRAYLQLAERADHNRQIDVVSEPPPTTLLFSWFVTWELPPVLAASLLTSCAAAPGRPNSKSTGIRMALVGAVHVSGLLV